MFKARWSPYRAAGMPFRINSPFSGGGKWTPYGTPVPNKPGYVTSPHPPFAGYVDLRGFSPGAEVKCPYTGELFLVP